MPAVHYVDSPDDASVVETFQVAEKHFGHVPNLVRALGHNPALCKSVTEFFAQAMGEGSVSWAFKELVIMKTLRAIGAYYGYGSHEQLARELGNSEERIGDVANSLWEVSDHFSDAEKAVFGLVRQIGIDANDVKDEQWEELRSHWSNEQLIELNALITTFIMIGRLGDTLGVSEPAFFAQPVG